MALIDKMCRDDVVILYDTSFVHYRKYLFAVRCILLENNVLKKIALTDLIAKIVSKF